MKPNALFLILNLSLFLPAQAFSQTFSKQVGVYAHYDKKNNELNVKASFYYFCKDNPDSEKCNDDLTWNWDKSEDPNCTKIESGTFKDYHFTSGTLALKNPVSVDPSTVPTPLCKFVKKVTKNVVVPVDLRKCHPSLVFVSGSLDSSSQLVIDKSRALNTPFKKRCAKYCSESVERGPEHSNLCLWCDRTAKGDALFPETHGPDVADICGSASEPNEGG